MPGPGGFYGGAPGQDGFGPGAGIYAGNATKNGSWSGPLSLVPIIGGSGGAGWSNCGGWPGGGGGGAIVIASSASIALSGVIDAYSNLSFSCGLNGQSFAPGGGGAIRLVSNSLNVRWRPDMGSCGGLEAPLNALVSHGHRWPLIQCAPRSTRKLFPPIHRC